ncbi:MAG: SDR family oxidoreductase [Deltaproteobacteria bacterium]|nr:SDR family oxidoreductase [Deltaproteobacteria bacterium]
MRRAAEPRSFLVTGAASGIGRAVAETLLARGAQVVATDLDLESLGRVAKEWPRGTLEILRLDVTDVEDWRLAVGRAAECYGRLDVLYNIAGFLTPGWVHEFDVRDVDRHLAVNVKGVMLGTRIAAEHMVAHGAGHIVNVASMAAYAPIPGLALYSASKYAVRAFSLAAATELRPRGVAVSVLCPDAVATPMLDKQADYDEASLTFSAPRILSASEVADVLTGRILRERPLELALPRARKWLARAADLVPAAAEWMRPMIERAGRAKRKARRR